MAIAKAQIALSQSLGAVGADGSVPGTTVPSSNCERTPTGSSAKNASHQEMTMTNSEPAMPMWV